MKKIILSLVLTLILFGCTNNFQTKENTNEQFTIGSSINKLEQAKSPEIIEIKDKTIFNLKASIIEKELNGNKLKMYAYNNMIPGPTFKVKQNSNIKINFTNNIDQNTTIHWHGLRHNVKDDGVPGISQDPIKPGESYSYNLFFPDAGIYWYHPHIREDIQQEGGLAGNIIVEPLEEDYYNKVDKEEIIVLDDILLTDGQIEPFGKEHSNFAIMGRFGNNLLINGDTNYNLELNKGEVVRFYITNVANVRPFNLSFEGAKIKLIGSDLGKYEKETFVDSIIIAPAERYIIEVKFEESKEYKIFNINPVKTYDLGKIKVKENNTKEIEFEKLKSNNEVVEDINKFREYFNKKPDYNLDLTIDMPNMKMMHNMEEPEKIEWEDDMGVMNLISDSSDITWIIKDSKSKKKNMDFMMKAKVGDKLKIRLFNDPKSMHPMQHPIHLHGQRFLVLSENGIPNNNLVWKDTVLVQTGSTIEILVDVTNPGEWMMHCHIAEHLESGMMTALEVKE
ncbi:multicopper oxidase family protein [Candidatus Woesearchaeota archaeon]|nr:multicopper oxidase family protein [Candidatus Woesearchaeota archaeon]